MEQTRSFSRGIQGHQESQAYQEQMGNLGLKVTQGHMDPQVRKDLSGHLGKLDPKEIKETKEKHVVWMVLPAVSLKSQEPGTARNS